MENLEKIADHLRRIDLTLERNTVTLEEHVRRTDLLEKQMEPVKRHVARVEGALKAIGLLALIVELWKRLAL